MTPAYAIVVSPRARTDLHAIGLRTARVSPVYTARVLAAIFNGFDSFELLPHRTVVPTQPASRRPPVRLLPVNPHVIFFRVDDESKQVRVTRVRHGARRPLKRFD